MAGALFNGIPMIFVASAARSSNGNTGTLKNTTTGFPVCQAAALFLDVTAQSGTTPLLDVSIDTSIDGGTTWYVAYFFAQVGAATGTFRLDIRDTGVGYAEVGSVSTVSSGVTSAINQNTVLSADIRIRWQIAGGTPSYTFSVSGIFQPMGSQN